MIRRVLVVAACVPATATGCVEHPTGSAPSAPSAVLHLETLDAAHTGLDATVTSGSTPSTQIVEVNGSGLALIDYDGDGDLDLFVGNGATMSAPESGPGCRLYENTGNLKFRDVTDSAGIDVRHWVMGVSVGDYDGDSRDDLYLTCFGPNILLRNDDGTFRDVTDRAGVGDPRWSTSSAFGDIDADGDLDLYVVNYLEFDVANPPSPSRVSGIKVMAGPNGLQAQTDTLYENLGDGTFRDVTDASGVGSAAPAYGLGVVIIDVDGDGRQDIFVGNDSVPNYLFHNTGGGRFEGVGGVSGIAANADGGEQATMGIGIADVDDNGRPDFFTTNFSSDTNTLHLNLGKGGFDDRTSQFGLAMISRPFLSWGTGFYDFDSDGDEDLFIASGHVYPETARNKMDSDYEQTQVASQRIEKLLRISPNRFGSIAAK